MQTTNDHPIAVDLLSDTVTLPPVDMRAAICRAEVGDDVYGEDPTVNRLEELAAERLGMEAALFLPSGTMANLLALLCHAPRGSKVLVGDRSDVWRWEAGGASVLGSLVYHPVPTQASGELAIEDLEAAASDPVDPQCAPCAVVCVENTHCMTGGRVLSFDYLERLREFADRHQLAVHLDGARLWNAAVALEVDARWITKYADSVMFCLSKGLSAPAGSMLAGTRPLIDEARRLRKMLGGGMRQAGFLAAAGIYALNEMVERLSEDHANARRLYDALARVPGVQLDPDPPETNIVFWSLADPAWDVAAFLEAMSSRGIRVAELGKGRIRAVTHYGIEAEDINWAANAVRDVLASDLRITA